VQKYEGRGGGGSESAVWVNSRRTQLRRPARNTTTNIESPTSLRGGITTTYYFLLYNGAERMGDRRLFLHIGFYFLSVPAIALGLQADQ